MAADRLVFRYVESARPWSNGEFAGSHLVHLDTVHASGLVTSHVRGTCDGQYVDARATHYTPADGARDLERVSPMGGVSLMMTGAGKMSAVNVGGATWDAGAMRSRVNDIAIQYLTPIETHGLVDFAYAQFFRITIHCNPRLTRPEY